MTLADIHAIRDAMDGQQLCRLGHHAWVPWLAVTRDDGTVNFYVIWCARKGCEHTEQYDL